MTTFDNMSKWESNEAIDAVIAWVDGNQKEQRKKLAAYIEKEEVGSSPNVIPSRFDASDEIKYCILSIFKFAPFIRHIYIVTDGQKPQIEDIVNQYFPERLKDIIYVDHQVIFNGYEQYLPIFNSRAIESMLWRIPNISDNFLYFNDDFFLVKPLQYEDLKKDNKLILRGKWNVPPLLRLLWHQVIVPKKKRRASYHLGMWRAARTAGYSYRYFVFEHTPYLISKSAQERYFTKNPIILENNISYRFRNPAQFNPCSLAYHLALKEGIAIAKNNSQLSYLQPHGRDADYIQRKTKNCETDRSILFMCVQDLSIAHKSQVKEVYTWLQKTLALQ